MPETSFRVMKISEFPDSVFYRAACSCGSSDHTVEIELEKDKEIPEMVFLNFYKDVAWCDYWGNKNIFQRFWLKTKAVCRIIFTGYIHLEESFILQGEEQINEFIDALKEGKKHVQNSTKESM